MDLEFLKRRASNAKTILDNEAFQAAVSDIERDLIEQWKGSKAKNSEDRETLYMGVRQLHDIVSRLRRYIETAEYEKAKQSK